MVFNLLQRYLPDIDNLSLSNDLLLINQHLRSECLNPLLLRLFGLWFLDQTVPLLIELQVFFCFFICELPVVEASECSAGELIEKANDLQRFQNADDLGLIDRESHGCILCIASGTTSDYDLRFDVWEAQGCWHAGFLNVLVELQLELDVEVVDDVLVFYQVFLLV